MMMHGQGHLELIQLGAVPVFLVAWLRFVDRPTPGRLLAAWAAFVLVAASAAYFVVLAPVPAAWYVAWRAYDAARRGDGAWAWLRARVVPLLGFAALVVPVLLVLFSPQVWAAVARVHGDAGPWAEFEWYGVPPWGYVVPTGLARPRPAPAGPALRRASATTGRRRSRSPRTSASSRSALIGLRRGPAGPVPAGRATGGRRFAVLVVLSMGATLRSGGMRVDLPGSWLWSVFPPFRLIRVPRGSTCWPAVVAAVLAAAGLRDLLGRLSPGRARARLVRGRRRSRSPTCRSRRS